VGTWEPLGEGLPVDVRRLSTQLRRMKDRSGLTVPALAARTAQPAEVWARAFAGRQLPPLDAVEVLAQASGADYDRIGALWRLAEKAAAGAGDRIRGKPVPYPDPLDPLGPEEGLPGRRRGFLLLGAVGLLAAAALVAVLLMAGTSTGRSPAGDARPAAPAGATPFTGSSGSIASTGGRPGTSPASPAAPATVAPGAASPGRTTLQPAGTPGASSTPETPRTRPAAGGVPSGAPPGTGRGATSPPPSSPPAAPTSPVGATPGPTQSGWCLGLLLLGVCIG
jgi:hypothetical protein